MKGLISWVQLLLGLREPTPEENVAQLRHAASVMMVYSPSTAARLFQQADQLERRLARE